MDSKHGSLVSEATALPTTDLIRKQDYNFIPKKVSTEILHNKKPVLVSRCEAVMRDEGVGGLISRLDGDFGLYIKMVR